MASPPLQHRVVPGSWHFASQACELLCTRPVTESALRQPPESGQDARRRGIRALSCGEARGRMEASQASRPPLGLAPLFRGVPHLRAYTTCGAAYSSAVSFRGVDVFAVKSLHRLAWPIRGHGIGRHCEARLGNGAEGSTWGPSGHVKWMRHQQRIALADAFTLRRASPRPKASKHACSVDAPLVEAVSEKCSAYARARSALGLPTNAWSTRVLQG